MSDYRCVNIPGKEEIERECQCARTRRKMLNNVESFTQWTWWTPRTHWTSHANALNSSVMPLSILINVICAPRSREFCSILFSLHSWNDNKPSRHREYMLLRFFCRTLTYSLSSLIDVVLMVMARCWCSFNYVLPMYEYIVYMRSIFYSTTYTICINILYIYISSVESE